MTTVGGPWPAPSPSRGQLRDLAARERAEFDRWHTDLAGLRADPTWPGLARARLRGRTGEQWAVARQAAEAAGSMLRKALAVVDEAGRLLDSRAPDATAVPKALDLLLGGSVQMDRSELPKPDRRPPWSTSEPPRYSLSEVKGLIDSDLRVARRIAADAAAVHGAADPRIEALTAELDTVRAAADPAADAAALPVLAEAAAELDLLRDLVANDPLALHTALPAGIDPTRFDALARRLAALHEGLASSIALRAETERRASRLATAINDLFAQEALARDRRSAALRAGGRRAPAAPGSANRLETRLKQAKVRSDRDWHGAPRELAEIEAEVAAAQTAVRQVVAWAGTAARTAAGPSVAVPSAAAPSTTVPSTTVPSAAAPSEVRRAAVPCVRLDCPGGGVLDEHDVCDTCDRGPAPVRPARTRVRSRPTHDAGAAPGAGSSGSVAP